MRYLQWTEFFFCLCLAKAVVLATKDFLFPVHWSWSSTMQIFYYICVVWTWGYRVTLCVACAWVYFLYWAKRMNFFFLFKWNVCSWLRKLICRLIINHLMMVFFLSLCCRCRHWNRIKNHLWAIFNFIHFADWVHIKRFSSPH